MPDGKSPEILTPPARNEKQSPLTARRRFLGGLVAALAAGTGFIKKPQTALAQTSEPLPSEAGSAPAVPTPGKPDSIFTFPGEKGKSQVIDINPPENIRPVPGLAPNAVVSEPSINAKPDKAIDIKEKEPFVYRISKLEKSVKTLFPEFYSRLRIVVKDRGSEYSITTTPGLGAGNGTMPSINVSTVNKSESELDYSSLRVAEEVAGLLEELKEEGTTKRMVQIYDQNPGRGLIHDLKGFNQILDIHNYADTADINESNRHLASELVQAYKEGFSRIMIEPSTFQENIEELKSTKLKTDAADFALSLIWATIDCASQPTTIDSLGIDQQLFNYLVVTSGKKEYWQRVLKKVDR